VVEHLIGNEEVHSSILCGSTISPRLLFMLTGAFTLLTAAALFGSLLAVAHLRGGSPPPFLLGALHGLIGLGGLAILLLALRGPARGVEQGAGAFGMIAAALLALAAMAGLTIFLRLRLQRRNAGTLIGVHATLAVAGLCLLLAYVLA
jgi:hypothetical protein